MEKERGSGSLHSTRDLDKCTRIGSAKMKMQATMSAAYSHKHAEIRQVDSQKADEL